jgi:hypothetical protein
MKDADGEIVLPPGKLFMPTARSFCRQANRLCQQRDRSAAGQIVYADGSNDFLLGPLRNITATSE